MVRPGLLDTLLEELTVMIIRLPSIDQHTSTFSPCSRIEIGVRERNDKMADGWKGVSASA